MSTPISLDLRERIAAAIAAAEESHPLIAERFCVSVTTVERISRKRREGRSLEPATPPGRPPLLEAVHHDWLRKELAKDPYVTSYDLTARFKRRFPKLQLHRSTILRAMHQLGFTFKKNSVRAPA